MNIKREFVVVVVGPWYIVQCCCCTVGIVMRADEHFRIITNANAAMLLPLLLRLVCQLNPHFCIFWTLHMTVHLRKLYIHHAL